MREDKTERARERGEWERGCEKERGREGERERRKEI